MDDSEISVNRWRRYGKDRLYVTLADDTKVGFWDLTTEEAHPDSPEHLPVLLAAAEAWRVAQSVGAVPAQHADAAGGQTSPSRPDVPRAEPAGQAELAAPAQPAATPWSDATRPETTPEAAAQPAVPRPWIDLTTNRAGAEAREQALAARDAAPVRTFLARALGVHNDERAWRIGADGEVKVAAQLDKVAKKDPRWRFLHAIPVGNRGSDIDHLAIGPGGVFTVNAKHHPGAKIWVGGSTFMVNGAKQPYIRNSRYEAVRAAKLLTAACGFPVGVEGLIVTVNASDVVIKSEPEGVHVAPRMQVATWLLRHGDILGDHARDAIYEAARRSSTWRPS